MWCVFLYIVLCGFNFICKLLNSALFTMLCGRAFYAVLSLNFMSVLSCLQKHSFCKSFMLFIDLALLNLLSKCTRLIYFTSYCANFFPGGSMSRAPPPRGSEVYPPQSHTILWETLKFISQWGNFVNAATLLRRGDMFCQYFCKTIGGLEA